MSALLLPPLIVLLILAKWELAKRPLAGDLLTTLAHPPPTATLESPVLLESAPLFQLEEHAPFLANALRVLSATELAANNGWPVESPAPFLTAVETHLFALLRKSALSSTKNPLEPSVSTLWNALLEPSATHSMETALHTQLPLATLILTVLTSTVLHLSATVPEHRRLVLLDTPTPLFMPTVSLKPPLS